jgi:hypothetical protein
MTAKAGIARATKLLRLTVRNLDHNCHENYLPGYAAICRGVNVTE